MITYNKLVESCFFQAQHVGTLDCSRADTVCVSVEEQRNGIRLDLYLSCQTDGLIDKACFRACGNPYVIAGAEYLCRRLQGTSAKEHPCLDYHELVRQLGIPRVQYPLAVLIERAYHQAIQHIQDRLKGSTS